jgi:hypothetical protein
MDGDLVDLRSRAASTCHEHFYICSTIILDNKTRMAFIKLIPFVIIWIFILVFDPTIKRDNIYSTFYGKDSAIVGTKIR